MCWGLDYAAVGATLTLNPRSSILRWSRLASTAGSWRSSKNRAPGSSVSRNVPHPTGSQGEYAPEEYASPSVGCPALMLWFARMARLRRRRGRRLEVVEPHHQEIVGFGYRGPGSPPAGGDTPTAARPSHMANPGSPPLEDLVVAVRADTGGERSGAGGGGPDPPDALEGGDASLCEVPCPA